MSVCPSAICWGVWGVLWAKPIVLHSLQGCFVLPAWMTSPIIPHSPIWLNFWGASWQPHKHRGAPGMGAQLTGAGRALLGTAHGEIRLEEKAKGALTSRAKHFEELWSGTVPWPSPDGNSLSSSERHEGFVLGHQMASVSKNTFLLLAQTSLLGQPYSIPSN